MARTEERPILVMADEEDPECAWCNEEQGKPQGNGSHGICKSHVKQIEMQYKAIKASRKERIKWQ